MPTWPVLRATTHLTEPPRQTVEGMVERGRPSHALGVLELPATPAIETVALDPAAASARAALRRGPAWEGTDKRITILSCGLGQDSTALALMMADGHPALLKYRNEDPQLDCIVAFADTGSEWAHTYDFVPQFAADMEAAGLRFVILRKPPLGLFFSDPDKSWTRPVPGETPYAAAERGRFHRRPDLLNEFYWRSVVVMRAGAGGSCTFGQKVSPMRRFMGAMDEWAIGLTNDRRSHLWRDGRKADSLPADWSGGRAPKNRKLLGIAADEPDRAGENDTHYEENHYPLIEMGMGKPEIRQYLADRGYGHVYKSGCSQCPYQGDGWYWLLSELEPARFAAIVQYESNALEFNPKAFLRGDRPIAEVAAKWRRRNRHATPEQILSKAYNRGNRMGGKAGSTADDLQMDLFAAVANPRCWDEIRENECGRDAPAEVVGAHAAAATETGEGMRVFFPSRYEANAEAGRL